MTRPPRVLERIASRLVQVGFLIAVGLAWYLAVHVGHVNRLLLPDPVKVWHQLVNVIVTGDFVSDLRVTATELVVAVTVSTICGVTVGYAISRSPYFIRVFEPLFSAIFSIPLILFLPLYVLFFGLGLASKIALGITISFFPIALNTIAGFGNVDEVFVVVARSMGASNFQMFRYVLLPAALPTVLTGLRIGFTMGLLSIIASETIASFSGLGHRIVDLAENLNMPRMFAYIVFVVALAASLNWAVSALEARGRRRQ